MGQNKSRPKMDDEVGSGPPPRSRHASSGAHGPSTETRDGALLDVLTPDILIRCKRFGDDNSLSEVWRYDAKTVIKRISGTATGEVAAMRLVSEKTSIPVPRVIKTIEQREDDISYIFMEYIDGQPLDRAWSSYDADQRGDIVSRLRGFFHELRQVKGPFIGSVDSTACNDQIFANRAVEYGPYNDEKAFRAGMAQSLRNCDADPVWTEVVIGFIEALPEHESIFLTHGDLVPRNILVRDGKVVAIVDWEMSGFYPEYWGYAKGHFFADFAHPWMEERVLDKVLTPYRVELSLLLHTRKVYVY